MLFIVCGNIAKWSGVAGKYVGSRRLRVACTKEKIHQYLCRPVLYKSALRVHTLVITIAIELVVGHTAARGSGAGVKHEVVAVRVFRVDLVDIWLIISVECIEMLVIEGAVRVR